MDLDDLFVLNLKKWRKNRGVSQKTLAERCDAAHSYIRQLESGSGHPSFAFIGKLAHALNIEPYQLFYDETAVQSGNPVQTEPIESIKKEFIEKMAHELDTLIDKLKPYGIKRTEAKLWEVVAEYTDIQ
jgi:transcriptional regulator with XRE-family HTH domain